MPLAFAAAMQIDNLNYTMGATRDIVQKQYHPSENEVFYRTAALGIDYDSLTPEEFAVLVGILEKSEFKENSVSRRGRNRPTSHKKGKK